MGFKAVDLNPWTILKISGPDKLSYLNGITTFDLEKLKEIKICQTAFLAPNAKIRSVFWLSEIDDHYIIYTPPQMRENLIADLLKYKLDMNIKLEDIQEETPPLYLIRSDAENKYTIKFGNVLFEFHQTKDKLDETIDYTTFEEWMVKNEDIPIKIFIDQNPLEAGISNAITLEKGCFLGQEPLSRMYHRGRPRKFLYQIITNSILSNELFIDNISVGNVLQSVQSGDQHISIVYIKSSVNLSDKLIFDNITHSSLKRIGSYLNIER